MVSSEYAREWREKNRDKINAYARIHSPAYYKKLRDAVLAFLGNKCSNPACRYLNLDGTLGCTDVRLLHVDHINGGGNKERKGKGGATAMYRKILAVNGEGYRLLCANCNWLHLHEEF
jgi:hypothetical protein